jgi:hypothetical protein
MVGYLSPDSCGNSFWRAEFCHNVDAFIVARATPLDVIKLSFSAGQRWMELWLNLLEYPGLITVSESVNDETLVLIGYFLSRIFQYF